MEICELLTVSVGGFFVMREDPRKGKVIVRGKREVASTIKAIGYD